MTVKEIVVEVNNKILKITKKFTENIKKLVMLSQNNDMIHSVLKTNKWKHLTPAST